MQFNKVGSFDFLWTVSNGSCISTDSLTINYVIMTDTPTINYSNGVITSSLAPAYQWYLDGNPINGAVGKTHTPTVN